MSKDMLDVGEEELSTLYKSLIILQNIYLDIDDARNNMTDEVKQFSDRLFDATQIIKEIISYG